MHNAAFDALSMDAIYLALNVKPDHLMSVLPSMKQMGFGGVNLTVPLKEVAFRGLEQLDESAQLLGAVNTVQFTDQGLKGYNTDGFGFLTAVEEAFEFSVSEKSLFILGCGGAGRAVALMSAQNKASRIQLADVDMNRANAVAGEIMEQFPTTDVVTVPHEQWQTTVTDTDLVVQATPIGMKPDDPALLDVSAFRAGQCVFDLIYMYPETPILTNARQAGAHVANGLGMLLHQGAKAFSIWNGVYPPVDVMRSVLEKAVYA